MPLSNSNSELDLFDAAGTSTTPSECFTDIGEQGTDQPETALAINTADSLSSSQDEKQPAKDDQIICINFGERGSLPEHLKRGSEDLATDLSGQIKVMCCDGPPVFVSRALLTSASHLFRRAFCAEQTAVEINLPDVSSCTLRFCVSYEEGHLKSADTSIAFDVLGPAINFVKDYECDRAYIDFVRRLEHGSDPISIFIYAAKLGEDAPTVAMVRRYADQTRRATTASCTGWGNRLHLNKRCFDARLWSFHLVSQVPIRYYWALVKAINWLQKDDDWSGVAAAFASNLAMTKPADK